MMKSLLAVAAIAAMTFGAKAEDDVYYYPITVNYGQTAIATNFPVLVRIPAGSEICQSAGTNGEYLRFTDESGNVDYPHEVDTWSSTGESLVWVKLPKLTDGFAFRLYCTGGASTTAKEVWTDYAGVWHLNEPKDSSEKDIDPDVEEETHTTKFFDNSSAVANAPIGVGRGQSQSKVAPVFGSKVYVQKGAHAGPIQLSDANRFTVSCWFRLTDSSYPYGWTTFFGARTSHNGGWGATWCGSASKPQLRVELTNSGSTWKTYDIPLAVSDKFDGECFAFNKWARIVVVYNNKSHEVYFNGVSIGSIQDLTDTPKWDWAGWMGWGGLITEAGAATKTDDARPHDFDECRIYNGVVDAAWVAADYATVTNSSFLTIGAKTKDEVPEGTVAQVGGVNYADLSEAVIASGSSGDPIVLCADGLSWTFSNEGETLVVMRGVLSFETINGLGEGYYVDVSDDSSTGVTTYQLKKQVKVAAMRNVAIYKQLHTRDLASLLPEQVAGLDERGEVLGMYDVVWNVTDITKYDSFGISRISGVATVGGEQMPVTAFVRATLSYSDDFHNLAQETVSMVATAPDVDAYPYSEIPAGSAAMITNGLAAKADITGWADGNGSLSTWTTGKENPYLDVRFEWGEVKRIHRIEVIARTTNNIKLKSIAFAADGVAIEGYGMPEPNIAGSERVNSQYNHRYDFTTPIDARVLNITLEQGVGSDGQSTHMDLEEILIWGEGGPIDKNEMSTSAELTKLEMDGNPVKVMPGVVSYLVQGAEAVTLAEGAANVAPTVLPMTSDGRIRIVTMGEDGSTMTYRLKTRGGFAIHAR